MPAAGGIGTLSHWRTGSYRFVRRIGPDKRAREALIKSGFERDDPQVVRKCREIIAALAAEGFRRDLIRIYLAFSY